MRALENIFLSLGRPLRIAADDKLLVRGSISKRVYFVRSGQVLLHSSSHDGREIGFEVIGRGQVLGFSASVSGRSFLDGTALTACDLLLIEIETLEKALKNDATATLELLRYISGQLYRRTQQAEGLALYGLRGRLARRLITLAREQLHGEWEAQAVVRLDFNQKLIAVMAGVSRETVNRQIHDWVRAGIIEVEGKSLKILKPNALAELAAPIDEMPIPRGAAL
jgi:CRP-like cAMP-binding protein